MESLKGNLKKHIICLLCWNLLRAAEDLALLANPFLPLRLIFGADSREFAQQCTKLVRDSLGSSTLQHFLESLSIITQLFIQRKHSLRLLRHVNRTLEGQRGRNIIKGNVI